MRRWLIATAKAHRREVESLAFVLMSDNALLEYNRRYLKHDYFTDVITFSYSSDGALCGDVLMSYDRIKANAVSFDTSVQDELRRVMVHGLLHLLGQTDNRASEKLAMRANEDRSLQEYARLGRNPVKLKSTTPHPR
ncbi:MAG: rRNA maturation RNase YbeY [Flavobacteriales bacterium]|nr:rRNA maturation RNase YbeY [Flavobacteriales bacterium]